MRSNPAQIYPLVSAKTQKSNHVFARAFLSSPLRSLGNFLRVDRKGKILRCESDPVIDGRLHRSRVDYQNDIRPQQRTLPIFKSVRASHPQADIVKKQMSGGSTPLAFEIAGGKEGACRFLNGPS